MKLIILKTNFKEGLSVIEHAITDNVHLPILKNVLLKTTENKIKLSGTNLELGINSFINAKITEQGSLTIPFQTLNNIISNTDSDRISLETDKNNLLISTDNYKARIQGIEEKEFPIIPTIENKESFLEINSTIFKDALLKVIYAAQVSEIRPEISGVLFDFQITVLKLVATDSFRLAEKTLFDKHLKTNFKEGFRIIIPLKTIQEIIRIFPDDSPLTIQTDANQILIKNKDHELISRLISGEYPDYKQIIPKNIETEAILNREKFMSAVKLVSSLTGKVNEIKVRSKKEDGVIEVYSSNQQIGENSYLIPTKLQGDDFSEISFNWRYLNDGLKSLKNEKITFGVNGDNKPAILKATEDTSYFYIVMPIKPS